MCQACDIAVEKSSGLEQTSDSLPTFIKTQPNFSYFLHEIINRDAPKALEERGAQVTLN